VPQQKPSNAASEDLILATVEELGGGAVIVLDRELRSYDAGHLGARATQLRTVISLEFLGGRDRQN